MSDAPNITPADIETKFREIQGQIDVVAEDGKKRAAIVGSVVGVLVLLLVYLAGRRTGKRRSSVIEIRRL